MKNKVILSGILLLALIASQVFASNYIKNSKSKSKYIQYDNKVNIKNTSYDILINSGEYKGIAFQETYFLEKSNGSYVNFWIKNNGAYPVTIKINENEKTIDAKKDGHISSSVVSSNSKYSFTANSPYG